MNLASSEIGTLTVCASWLPVRKLVAARPRLDARWSSIKVMRVKAEKAFTPYKSRYKHLQQLWERKLRHLCGELYGLDWTDFRPLRLSREEDWSDWLAWLLETSTTGILAEVMLGQYMGCSSASFKTPKKVRREDWTETGERRADIVAVWRGRRKTHIEVKLWDKNFQKTFETCRLLHNKEPGWSDAILIPEESRADWDKVAQDPSADGPVNVILWNDVVRGLRRSLRDNREPVAWQVWAWTFCGAVEFRLLGLRKPDLLRSRIGNLNMVSKWVEVLSFTCRTNNMDTEMKSFLREGIGSYSGAKQTLDLFEKEMEELLRMAVQSRAHWSPLDRHDIVKLKWGGAIGRWLAMDVNGGSSRGKDVVIDCGLWWDAPVVNASILYAAFNGVKFQWPKSKEGISSFECEDFDKTFLYVPMPKTAEIEKPLNRLLDALLLQLG